MSLDVARGLSYRSGVRRLLVPGLALLLSCSMIAGVPASDGAPAVGGAAPVFTLPDENGTSRSLPSLLATADDGMPGSVLLVFYRGHW